MAGSMNRLPGRVYHLSVIDHDCPRSIRSGLHNELASAITQITRFPHFSTVFKDSPARHRVNATSRIGEVHIHLVPKTEQIALDGENLADIARFERFSRIVGWVDHFAND